MLNTPILWRTQRGPSYVTWSLWGLPPLSLKKMYCWKAKEQNTQLHEPAGIWLSLYTAWLLSSPASPSPHSFHGYWLLVSIFHYKHFLSNCFGRTQPADKYLLCIRHSPRCWGISKEYTDKKPCPQGGPASGGFLGTKGGQPLPSSSCLSGRCDGCFKSRKKDVILW